MVQALKSGSARVPPLLAGRAAPISIRIIESLERIAIYQRGIVRNDADALIDAHHKILNGILVFQAGEAKTR
jgi:hypothetical protein